MKNNKLKFVIIGVAGFIAPRHLKAIKDLDGELIAALDKTDSVGILDSYFPDAKFFTEFEKFEAYLSSVKLSGESIDYLSRCSPNYLHNSHIQFGLR
jgi:UDP-N-acetyl-2-amino-2-deoxyglucuronate dehydrogenase